MTDQQIADQIVEAARKVLKRAEQGNPVTKDDRDRQLVAEYLSGANQVAHFLVANDGAVTPHQVQRALRIAGERLGFTLGKG